MRKLFYLGTGMQLFGMTLVTLCMISGFRYGDYGQLELFQLCLGSLVFYTGHYLKLRAGK